MSVSPRKPSPPTAEQDVAAHLCGRILLAEDSSALRRLVGHVLLNVCQELVLAKDGQEAVELAVAADAAGRPFDLILMDVMMPRLNGVEATYQLRQQGYGGRVVILTAADEEYDMARSLCAGADDFLAKPFTPVDLQRVVREHAGKPAASA